MIRYLLAITFIVSFSHFVQGQEKNNFGSTLEQQKVEYPRSAIKWKPLFLLNRFATFQLAYEFRVSDQINLELNGGYIYDPNRLNRNQDFQNRRGLKSGLYARRYLSSQRKNAFYFSTGVDYFYITFDRSRTLGFNCDNNFTCSFYRFNTYQVIRQDIRSNSQLGFIAEMGSDFFLEMAFGVVFGWRKFRTEGMIEGFDQQFGNTDLSENGDEFLVLPVLAINLVYKLK